MIVTVNLWVISCAELIKCLLVLVMISTTFSGSSFSGSTPSPFPICHFPTKETILEQDSNPVSSSQHFFQNGSFTKWKRLVRILSSVRWLKLTKMSASVSNECMSVPLQTVVVSVIRKIRNTRIWGALWDKCTSKLKPYPLGSWWPLVKRHQYLILNPGTQNY